MKLESSFVPQPFASSTKTGFRRRAMVAVRVALIAVAIFLCQGCLVMPVRAPTRTNGNSGAMEKISLDFLHSGKTTKDEVTTKLGGTDTGIRDKQFFVGRWATSHWGSPLDGRRKQLGSRRMEPRMGKTQRAGFVR